MSRCGAAWIGLGAFTRSMLTRGGAGLLICLSLLAGCSSQTAAPPASKPRGIYHTVRPGENLYRIGKAYDVNHEEIARLNRLRNAGQIRVGQRLFITGANRQLPVEIITPEESSAPKRRQDPLARGRGPVPGGGWQNFIWPISGAVNSPFGPRGGSFHDGIDISAPEGTPIRAIESGEVIFSDKLRGYGNMIIIRHRDGIVSVYAHNQVNLAPEGKRVARGEVVARVGSTGRVTGPHLHLEIRRENSAEDPLYYLPRLCCAEASDRVLPGG